MLTRAKLSAMRANSFVVVEQFTLFHSTKWALWLVDFWSRASDQIQMYPDRDTIAQLLPARRLCLFVFAIWKSKYITKHFMYGPSGN